MENKNPIVKIIPAIEVDCCGNCPKYKDQVVGTEINGMPITESFCRLSSRYHHCPGWPIPSWCKLPDKNEYNKSLKLTQGDTA